MSGVQDQIHIYAQLSHFTALVTKCKLVPLSWNIVYWKLFVWEPFLISVLNFSSCTKEALEFVLTISRSWIGNVVSLPHSQRTWSTDACKGLDFYLPYVKVMIKNRWWDHWEIVKQWILENKVTFNWMLKTLFFNWKGILGCWITVS